MKHEASLWSAGNKIHNKKDADKSNLYHVSFMLLVRTIVMKDGCTFSRGGSASKEFFTVE